MTKNIAVTLTDEQVEYLENWSSENRYKNNADAIRALLKIALGEDFPVWEPKHGGNRYQPPREGQTVILTMNWNAHREGTYGVVEKRQRHGAMVAFGNETILVPYRYLTAEAQS